MFVTNVSFCLKLIGENDFECIGKGDTKIEERQLRELTFKELLQNTDQQHRDFCSSESTLTVAVLSVKRKRMSTQMA